MKKSKYNYFFDDSNGKYYIYNTLSGCLAELDEEFNKIYYSDNYDSFENNELFLKLVKEGIIILDKTDENLLLREKYLSAQNSNDFFDVTIILTYDCNFRCSYCYEKDILAPKYLQIDSPVIPKLLQYITEKTVDAELMKIVLYGGEPLLNFSTLKYLTSEILNICRENNCKLITKIITNGYLLNDEIIGYFKKINLENIQITLDGLKEIHDQRRQLKNGRGSFQKIIDNIDKLEVNNLNTHIRINVDKDNSYNINELISFINEKRYKNVYYSVNKVIDLEGNSDKVFEDNYFNELLDSNKVLTKHRIQLPERKTMHCTAVHKNSIVIDPEGYIYKCWNDVGKVDLATTNILNEQLQYEDKWYKWNPLNKEKCTDCIHYPICAGGCPYVSLNGNYDCIFFKNTLKELLLDYINQKE